MAHLVLSNASLAFGHVPLLDHADFQLDPGERVALIGRNGTGKSSLLRALAGQGPLDDGGVWRQPGIRMGYVPQEPPFDAEQSVFEAVVSGMGELSALLAEYHAVSHALGEPDADHDALLERMHDLQTELESRDAWSFEAQAEKVIQRFSLDPDARVGSLSGGQKKRLALAQALAISPDLLLLDEPTNHLDLEMRQALTAALAEYEGSLVLVSHDRALLRTVCDDFLLVSDGGIQEFDGAIEDYIAWLAARRTANATGNVAATQGKAARREARESAAADRQNRLAARRPLLREAETLEKILADWQSELQQLNAQLADPAFYANPEPLRLRTLTERQQQLSREIDAAEQRWLEIHAALEAIGEA